MRYMDVLDVKYKSNFGIMGSEAIIYEVENGLFKKFGVSMEPQTRKNKEEKLLRLDKIDSLKQYYNEIVCMVTSVKDYISGYIVKKVPGSPLGTVYLDTLEKLEVLKKLKKILQEFEKEGIIYTDIHFDNVYYDETTKKIKLIDIDNVLMDHMPIDLLSVLYNDYYCYGGHDFDNARIYVFNLISFLYLTNKYDSFDINEISRTTYTKDYSFLNQEAKSICNNLLNIKIDSSCDHDYLIDAIDEKILVK